jgi:hypothetical protein
VTSIIIININPVHKHVKHIDEILKRLMYTCAGIAGINEEYKSKLISSFQESSPGIASKKNSCLENQHPRTAPGELAIKHDLICSITHCLAIEHTLRRSQV